MAETCRCILTLNLLTTTIVVPPSNASKWQMGFSSAFKGLIRIYFLHTNVVLLTTFNIYNKFLYSNHPHSSLPVPVASRSKTWVCGRSPAGVVGSNPTGGMDVYLL